MNTLDEKNNLAYLLHKELFKTVEKFMRKYPKCDGNVVLGAGNIYMAGYLINAPSKDEALKTLDANIELMRNLIDQTPDDFFFDGGIRNHFNSNLN